MDSARMGYFSDDTSNESGQVELYLQWVSLVTGGIPTTLLRSSGFGLTVPVTAAITRTGAGLFTVQFSQAWALKYLDFSATFQQATYAAGGVSESNILTDNLMATTGVMTINITNAAGAATDPTTGDVITLHWTMQSQTSGY